MRQRSRTTFVRRLYKLATLVLQARHRQPVVHRVAVLDVADRAGRLLNERGDTFVTLSAGANRPGHRLVGSDLIGEILTDGRKMLREDERRAASVRAESDVDRQIWQISRPDCPLRWLDRSTWRLSEKDADVGVARELEFRDARQVVGDHDTARRGWDHHHSLFHLGDFLVTHGGIAGREIDRALGELLDAGAGTD